MSSGDEGHCGLENTDNSTNPIGLQNEYGGIPQNLIFNSVFLTVLLVGFLIVRRSAYKVVNKLVKKDDLSKWTDVFFSFTADVATGVVTGVVEGAREVTDRVADRVKGVGGGGGGGGADPGSQRSRRSSAGRAEEGQADGSGDRSPSPASPSINDPGGGGDGNGDGDGDGDGDEDRSERTDETADVNEIVSARRDDQDEEGEGKVVPSSSAAAATAKPPPQVTRQFTLQNAPSYKDWLKSIFTMSDADILEMCGDDALQYLRYQRHVIFYMAIVVVLSICVILPLNFQGTLQGDTTSFEHTTLVNLDPNSDYLWAHVTFSFLFFPLAILIMRHFSKGVKFQEASVELRKTLMIDQIPRYLCREEDIRRHFEEAYETMDILRIHFAYDVEDLMEVDEELKKARLANEYLQAHESAGRDPLTLYPKSCSRCSACFCCCCADRVDAVEYYGQLETDLREEFDREQREALGSPLGIAFVTFRSVNMAKEVHDSFQRRSVLDWGFRPPASSSSAQLKVKDWKVSFAPTPDDLYWEHLSLESRFLLLKKIVVNTVLFLVTFFLTTPEYLISQTDWLVETLGEDILHLSSVVVDFLPTLMLWGFTALLPLLVAWSDRFLGHWTRSEENHNIMKKTFWFLLFMVVILPTFGFTTADAIVKVILDNNSTAETIRWECVFLPDSGAFFVNYIITAALTGAGLELIRFPELFFYLVRTCLSRSRADTPAIRDAIKLEFRFGEQYARMALIFCMTMMYCLSCPLITPFGLLFFVTKHYVDRHNLLYAYKPSKINKRVHSTAISFVIMGVVTMQFFMLVFLYIRNGEATDVSTLTKVMFGVFIVSVNVFSAQLWAETCRKISPIEYVEVTYIRDDVDQSEYVYLPEVLAECFPESGGGGGEDSGVGEAGRDQEYGTFR